MSTHNKKISNSDYKYHISKNKCKGCGLCIEFCRKNTLEISSESNHNGYLPVFQARPEDCTLCRSCCNICPDVAITIIFIQKKTKAA